MKKLIAIPGILGALLLSSCVEEGYGYRDEPAYRGGSVDFYYDSGRPYSRSYGQLYHRSGRYYYSRGGRYVIYDRPTTVVIRRDDSRDRRYRDWDSDRNRRDYDRRDGRYSSQARSGSWRDSNDDRRDTNWRERSTTVRGSSSRRDDDRDRRTVVRQIQVEPEPTDRKKKSRKKSQDEEKAGDSRRVTAPAPPILPAPGLNP